MDHASRQGRIVVELKLDGQPVHDALLSNPPDRNLGDELRALSADPKALVLQTLHQAALMLADLAPQHAEAGRLIQQGKTELAVPKLEKIIQSWQQTQQAVQQSVALLSLDVATITTTDARGQSQPFARTVGSLGSRLAELARTFQARDWAAVADVLVYDLGDDATRWQQLIGAIIQRIA
jgi:hypothetical protein